MGSWATHMAARQEEVEASGVRGLPDAGRGRRWAEDPLGGRRLEQNAVAWGGWAMTVMGWGRRAEGGVGHRIGLRLGLRLVAYSMAYRGPAERYSVDDMEKYHATSVASRSPASPCTPPAPVIASYWPMESAC